MKTEQIVCQILNYNDAFHVKQIINKIKDYKIFEYILIVDNHSSDNSFSELNKLYKNISHIKVISTPKNGGYGYGNNFGIKYAVNELHAKKAIICNPDVSFEENVVIRLISLMNKTDAAITSAVEVNKIPSINKAWRIPTPFAWILDETKLRNLSFKRFHYPNEYFESDYSQVDCVSGAMFLLDLKKFLNVDGYDEKMFLYGEETVLGFKFKQAGYKTYLLNSESYNHLHSASIDKSIPDKVRKIEILDQSKLYFFKTYLKENTIKYAIEKICFKYIEQSRRIVGKIKSKMS